jgi:hypothetical protein
MEFTASKAAGLRHDLGFTVRKEPGGSKIEGFKR